jgi:hypothetical protein
MANITKKAVLPPKKKGPLYWSPYEYRNAGLK